MQSHSTRGTAARLVAVSLLIALAGPPAVAAPGDPPAPRSGRTSAADANHDGYVDRDEWRAARDRRFERLDADRDGKLSRDEFQRTAQRGDQPRPQDGAGMRQGGQSRQNGFDRMDTDHDGFISRTEFNASSEQIFTRCDKDGDGRIARGECRPAGGGRSAARPAQPQGPAIR